MPHSVYIQINAPPLLDNFDCRDFGEDLCWMLPRPDFFLHDADAFNLYGTDSMPAVILND